MLANGVNGGNNEFIELLNVGATTTDAAGLIIDDGDARDTLTAYEEGGVTPLRPAAMPSSSTQATRASTASQRTPSS